MEDAMLPGKKRPRKTIINDRESRKTYLQGLLRAINLDI